MVKVKFLILNIYRFLLRILNSILGKLILILFSKRHLKCIINSTKINISIMTLKCIKIRNRIRGIIFLSRLVYNPIKLNRLRDNQFNNLISKISFLESIRISKQIMKLTNLLNFLHNKVKTVLCQYKKNKHVNVHSS